MTLLDTPIGTEQRVVLRDVSWQTYVTLLRELDGQHLFLTYDNGTLEIMSPSAKHAKIGKYIARLIETFTMELGIPIVGLGNTTWKSEAMRKGLEADECYYIQRAAWAAKREEFDLTVDPPPDLAVEVDITNSSVDKEAMYGALGVPELWRWDDDRLHVLRLGAEGRYAAVEQSASLPAFPRAVVEQFVRRRTQSDDTTSMLELRKWIQQNLGGG